SAPAAAADSSAPSAAVSSAPSAAGASSADGCSAAVSSAAGWVSSACCCCSFSSCITSSPSELALDVDPALLGNGQRPRERSARLAEARRVLELAGRIAKAQVEELLAKLSHLLDELVVIQVPGFLG